MLVWYKYTYVMNDILNIKYNFFYFFYLHTYTHKRGFTHTLVYGFQGQNCDIAIYVSFYKIESGELFSTVR